MNTIEEQCRNLLRKNGVNIDSEIDFSVNGDTDTLFLLYTREFYALFS